jgi:ligand-binding sensor domain-containing protein/signal transduction histidine kinase
LSPDKPLSSLRVVGWNTDDGLPSNLVTRVLQTHDGFLWMTTYNGLVRFDGRSFKVFGKRSIPSLRTLGFSSLYEDAEGTLWTGTQGGLVITQRGGRFQTWNDEQPLNATIIAVVSVGPGHAWIGAGDQGLFELRDGEVVAVEHPLLRDVRARSILPEKDGAVLVATEGNGVVRYVAGHSGVAPTATALTTADGLASDRTNSLWRAPSGELWIGTMEGLSRQIDGRVLTLPESVGISFNTLIGDEHGSVWMASPQGLYRYNSHSDELESLTEYEDRPLRGIVDLTFDHEGSLWLATLAVGLLQVTEARFTNVGHRDGLATERINVIYEDSPGQFLVGANDGTIHTLADGQASRLAMSLKHPPIRIRDFHRDRDGTLWVVSYAGLLRIRPGEERLLTTADGLPSNECRRLYEDHHGHLWVGTRNAGIFRREEDPNRLTVLDRSKGLASSFVMDLAEDSAGNLLVGSQEGVSIVQGGEVIRILASGRELPGSIVFNLDVDDEGAVWISTNAGLARFDGDEVKVYSSAHGLPVEALFDYGEDEQGAVWLSSASGVIRLLKADLLGFWDGRLESVPLRVFNQRDGMASRECTGATRFIQASDGQLYFPTMKGIAIVDPSWTSPQPVLPPIVIHHLDVDGEALPIDEVIAIAAGGKRYTFGFSVLGFEAPARVRSRYRLDGFDEDWIPAGDKRQVSYTKLWPGSYTFRVSGANGDGAWNEGTPVKIKIAPFLYQRPLFYVLAVILLSLLTYRLFRWQIAKAHRRAATLQAMVGELRQAQEEKHRLIDELQATNAELTRFTTAVSHDLKNPLVTILGFLGFLGKDIASGATERAQGDLKRIESAADVMYHRVEELSKLSRIGSVQADREPVAMAELARQAADLVDARIRETGAKVEIDPTLPEVFAERMRLLEVYQNLIDNAVKFIQDVDEPRVEVGWRPGDGDGAVGEPIFTVRDNGRGIEPKFHQEIFGLFRRLDVETEGTGVGLATVKRIIEVQGGRIWVESEGEGEGSTFCFTLGG